MMRIFEPWDFSVLDVENLRLHYAQTLRDWLALFETASGRVRDMFDEKFVRMWRHVSGGLDRRIHHRARCSSSRCCSRRGTTTMSR